MKLSNVVDTVTKLVNFIIARDLNHRQFAFLLEESESELRDVQYHTNVRWLSLGKVLKRVWDLRAEIDLLLKGKDVDFPQWNNVNWLSDFAFAMDVTGHTNELNSKLQGKGLFAHDMYSFVKSFMTKLLLFSCQIGNKQFTHFPTLQQTTVSDQNLERYTSLLLALHVEFSRHFEDFRMIENDFDLLPFRT
ncbi:unnamed protein product [Caretta caretta]